MKVKWTDQQDENPETAFIVEAGLNKLETYHERTELIPTYVLAMSGSSYFMVHNSQLISLYIY